MLYAATIPRGWNGDGIISQVGYWEELADFVRNADCPCVELTNVRQDLNIPHVEGDNNAIGVMAAQHFLNRGYRNFAWFPFTNDSINNERRDGFAGTVAASGFKLKILPALHELKNLKWQGNWAKNLARIADAVAALPKPVAIFCYNDCAAANVMSVCQERGILVPEQVAIAGVDNDELLCEAVSVPLTSVMHDLERVGYEGAAVLERLMNGEKITTEIPRIPPKGIIGRRSTDMVAVENVDVARALLCIRERYTDPGFQIDDIVASTDISRRPLEVAFKAEFGRTIHTEIMRLRIKHAKELMRDTTQSVKQIASATGFSRPNHLHRIFRSHTGMTPKKFRQQAASD
jgi:LacI family transcriptional regulator